MSGMFTQQKMVSKIVLGLVLLEDGVIFGQVVEELGLTGDGEDVKLLIVATQEGN